MPDVTFNHHAIRFEVIGATTEQVDKYFNSIKGISITERLSG